MGTRSNIIVKRADGKFISVYCHWDGYPEHHGPILTQHYASQERAEELVSHGDMSSLDERCDKPEGHSYDSPVDGCTVYYGRDRGEIGTEADTFDTLEAAWPVETGAEFVYVWADGAWHVGDPDDLGEGLRDLARVVAGDEDAPKTAIKAFGGNFVIGHR